MAMKVNTITSLEGTKRGGKFKWVASVAGADGCVYGIPSKASRIAKFEPSTKSFTEIGPDLGPDLGTGRKWDQGALDNKGCIYCLPYYEHIPILKIDTNIGRVILLDAMLPEEGDHLWASGATAMDGHIYCMPTRDAHRMLKINTEDDTTESVGHDLGDRLNKHSGTVAGLDGEIYGIPCDVCAIIKYNPMSDIIRIVGEISYIEFGCEGNGVVGRDGHIYAATYHPKVLRIDPYNNNYTFVVNIVETGTEEWRWTDAALGNDGCIYWSPCDVMKVLKYDTRKRECSLVGHNFGDSLSKWMGGATASDGVIYCIPCNVDQVLAIDPFREFTSSFEGRLERYPETLGRLFVNKNIVQYHVYTELGEFIRYCYL